MESATTWTVEQMSLVSYYTIMNILMFIETLDRLWWKMFLIQTKSSIQLSSSVRHWFFPLVFLFKIKWILKLSGWKRDTYNWQILLHHFYKYYFLNSNAQISNTDLLKICFNFLFVDMTFQDFSRVFQCSSRLSSGHFLD